MTSSKSTISVSVSSAVWSPLRRRLSSYFLIGGLQRAGHIVREFGERHFLIFVGVGIGKTSVERRGGLRIRLALRGRSFAYQALFRHFRDGGDQVAVGFFEFVFVEEAVIMLVGLGENVLGQ